MPTFLLFQKVFFGRMEVWHHVGVIDAHTIGDIANALGGVQKVAKDTTSVPVGIEERRKREVQQAMERAIELNPELEGDLHVLS